MRLAALQSSLRGGVGCQKNESLKETNNLKLVKGSLIQVMAKRDMSPQGIKVVKAVARSHRAPVPTKAATGAALTAAQKVGTAAEARDQMTPLQIRGLDLWLLGVAG
jgi:hypothetical protein